MLNSELKVTHRELLSVAPDVRNYLREAITTRRIVPGKEGTTQPAHLLDDSNDDTFATYAHKYTAIPPPGSFIVDDPYETYLRQSNHGHHHDELVVSLSSASLRTVQPLVDNQFTVECILDEGSSVVSMADHLCNALGLAYDPSVTIKLESANGVVNKSYGLARNVPFQFADITLYLQVHVVPSPAYDILLGRPFDILTESHIKNYSNEEQSITITDPNSGQVTMIPTLPRGYPQRRTHKEQVFRERRA